MDIKQMNFELLDVEGSYNVRDLGGYRGTGGAPIKKRRFIRAGALSRVTGRGMEQLTGLGVRCVIDLRSAGEAVRAPDPVLHHESIAYHHIPMMDYLQSNIDSGDFSTFPASMEEMYRGLLDKAQGQLCKVFRMIALARTAVLFHCTAGKDRTGVVTMLLLLLAGVDEAAVIEDYSWSERLIAPLLETQSSMKFPSYSHQSQPGTMEATIRYLKESYGGARSYLTGIGIGAAEQAMILEKCFE